MTEHQCEQRIMVVADSVQELRKCDVFWVIDWCRPEERVEVAKYICLHRLADLSKEVEEVLMEFGLSL